MNKYSLSEFVQTSFDLLLTKFFYSKARLIRRPVYIRGRKSLDYQEGLTLGHNVRFDLPGNEKTLYLGKNVSVGDYGHIVALKKVTIGDNCLMASKVFISDTSHGNYNGKELVSTPDSNPSLRPLISREVNIGKNVWIGENVCILLGVTIGDGCIIGANSVVSKDVPNNCIVAGAPAKVIKIWSKEKNEWVKKE